MRQNKDAINLIFSSETNKFRVCFMFHEGTTTETSSAKPLESRFEASLGTRKLRSPYEECGEEIVELITIKKSYHPHVPVGM